MSESKKNDRISKHELMNRVQEFCTSDEFEKEFEDFAKQYGKVFVRALDFEENSQEHPLEFHEVYREYLRRFEGIIENFIDTVCNDRSMSLGLLIHY